MVVNLLIGIAEDQDHMENILTKGLSETYGTEIEQEGEQERWPGRLPSWFRSPFCVTE